jgi:cell wall-associated NlpC family hydrolase
MSLRTTDSPARRLPRFVAAALTAAAALAASVAVATPAHAKNPAGPSDPIGAVESIANDSGTFTVTGWAADPDALTTNATVIAVIDGHMRNRVVTSIARPNIAKQHDTGPTPGFSLTVSPGTDLHTVCIAVANIGAGMPTVLRCFTSPRGSYVSSSAHSPIGNVASTSATAQTLTVSGHVNDPDFLARRMTVVLYVDGSPAKTVTSRWITNSAGQRVNHFSITVPVSTGAHLGCVWIVNVGYGANSFFGCSSADTRGAAGTGTVPTPKMNSKVVSVAKNQIGKPYVWAAAGPNSFDCSGLVVYSYAKAGMSGLYHQSEVQFTQARLIPASRAVPGDLVFYHDNVGDVYHVGIYLSPGRTVAAIDENQGVNYQNIWDPSSATYGSLTHS